MGCLFGGLLAEKGLNVILIDVWKEHVDAINKDGLKMDGHGGDRKIKVKATSDPSSLDKVDAVIVMCKATALDPALNSIKNINLKTSIKHEITEMALIEIHSEIKDIAVTVMDGPFFSLMPFPSAELHTLSHVRYTPHISWIEKNPVTKGESFKLYVETENDADFNEPNWSNFSSFKVLNKSFENYTSIIGNKVIKKKFVKNIKKI